MGSKETFNRVIPQEYHGRILTGDYSVSLKKHVAGYIDAYRAVERTGNPAIFYLSAWHEDDAGEIWYEFVSTRFARLMNCSRSEVAETFRKRVLDQHTLRFHSLDESIEEEVRTRETLDESARQLREDVRRRGIGDAIYKVDVGEGLVIWLKDVARIETHGEDRICLSSGCMTPVTKERRAEELRLERERLQVSLQMAGAVCHEMNQPMQSISGYAESCLMNVSDEDPLRLKLEKIITLTQKMAEITRKLTRITRYETKDYIEGVKIVDLDRASRGLPENE
ncbi:MAG: histidine kinase dimerization/phospho-acceptor domain-containing protein [Desulfobacteraceae bacterium]|jgi:C4-dicarboxylate-specific signal transduction histidine kinase